MRVILFVTLFLTPLFLEAKEAPFTQNSYYGGFGWKTFQMGRTQSSALVNGGTVRLNAGLYIPSKNIKLEFSASMAGGLGYKKYLNGQEIENSIDIGLLDYSASLSYGIGKRRACFDAYPFVLLGAGFKEVSYDVSRYYLPTLQLGFGFSIRSGGLEFFAKFAQDMLFNTQSFSVSGGDTISLQNFNGSLEVGFNHAF